MSNGNTERMRIELLKAVENIPENYSGFREDLVNTAIECISDTAAHDDKKLHINKRFDERIENIAKLLIKAKQENNK